MDMSIRLIKTLSNDRLSVINTTEAVLDVWNLQSHEEAYLKSVMHVGNWQTRYWNSQEDRGKSWKQNYPLSVGEILSPEDWLVREKKVFVDHMKEFNAVMSYIQPVMREFERTVNHRIREYMTRIDELARQVDGLESIGKELMALMDKVEAKIQKKRGK